MSEGMILRKETTMNDFKLFTAEGFDRVDAGTDLASDEVKDVGRPSNHVYARVGDSVLRAAREGVRGGMRPDDIIRAIVTEHNVRLNLGDLRLLLASRRIREGVSTGNSTGESISAEDTAQVMP
jgi:hypothetical protein